MANFSLHTFLADPLPDGGTCAAIGFFDGVHLGHRFLIRQVTTEAARRGLQPIAVSFEEHPRLALPNADYRPALLTTNAEKLRLLSQTGLSACALLHFDQQMARLTSREFMERILRNELRVRCLIVGYDHHFGSDTSARFDDYVRSGRDLGIDVVREQPFDAAGLRVSSSVVRRLLKEGDVASAARCLGRCYTLEGTVVEGHHVGTPLGFPTANIRPDASAQLIPQRGAYAVLADVDGQTYKAMLNIGQRPTLNNGDEETIEAHLLHYTGAPLYGHRLRISFVKRLRPERRFNSLEALKAQLAADAEEVERGVKSPSPALP